MRSRSQNLVHRISSLTGVRAAIVAVVLAGALGAIAATTVQAAAPDDDEVYHFKCYSTNQACVNGTHNFCDVSCNGDGCKCKTWDAQA
jgi:uncharacterized membrane protein